MNKEKEFQYYLSIAPNKFGIYLFDTSNLKNLYKNEITLNNYSDHINYDVLKKFLDDNIFKIEKLSGKFVENIFLTYESNKIFNLEIGIKKKNYNALVTKQYLENCLIDAKDLFRESYQDQTIIHMIINKYLINGETFSLFEENLTCDHLALEINFKSIPNNIIYDLNKILENYQIKITKYLDGSYIKSNFLNYMEITEMSYRILGGYNQNEVVFVPKSTKKLAFFEKFFQLFS
tara:strand:- start:3820 stop:4521 length:702 start_codon:yes stop_codon:yes gene_type:complete